MTFRDKNTWTEDDVVEKLNGFVTVFNTELQVNDSILNH